MDPPVDGVVGEMVGASCVWIRDGRDLVRKRRNPAIRTIKRMAPGLKAPTGKPFSSGTSRTVGAGVTGGVSITGRMGVIGSGVSVSCGCPSSILGICASLRGGGGGPSEVDVVPRGYTGFWGTSRSASLRVSGSIR